VKNRSKVDPRRSRGKQVAASLGVVSAAAAVAGMGTFGDFTQTTAPVDTSVDSGVVSIALNPAASEATVPFSPGGLLPGDTVTKPFDLGNDGNVAWSSVTFKSSAVVSSVLNTDKVNGLQITVESCPQSWAPAGTGYTCAGGRTTFYSGPIIMEKSLANAVSVTPGRTDHLLATIRFPENAGNAMKSQVSRLAFTFTAVQRDSAAR
jgi:hypothetical protein